MGAEQTPSPPSDLDGGQQIPDPDRSATTPPVAVARAPFPTHPADPGTLAGFPLEELYRSHPRAMPATPSVLSKPEHLDQAAIDRIFFPADQMVVDRLFVDQVIVDQDGAGR